MDEQGKRIFELDKTDPAPYKKAIRIDQTEQIVAIGVFPREIEDGWIEVESFPEGQACDYKYQDGKYVSSPMNERTALVLSAVDEALESVLDLQIRTSTLELTAEGSATE